MSDPTAPPAASLGPDAVYREKLAAGEFCIQHCGTCGTNVFYPRQCCPDCGGGELGCVAASGDGIVYSTTVVRRKPERGGDYNVAVIQLAEGPRLMSRVENIDSHAVAIDMKVRARITEDDGAPYVVFDPLDGEEAT